MKKYRTIHLYLCTCKRCGEFLAFNDDDVHFWSDDLYCYGNYECPYCNKTIRVQDEMVVGTASVEMTFWDRVKAFFCGC